LTVEEEVDRAFKEILNVFGRIDYAVNNAGVSGPIRPIAENNISDVDKVIFVNLKGLWLCERAELRIMEKQEPLSLYPEDSRFVLT
jgi:Dehydrogenases with different specificities (related to short-chain alcohol dehydrogenases)